MNLIEKIKEAGVEKEIRKNQVLFCQDEDADRFGYVLDGEIRVYKMDEQAREKEVGRFSKGAFFGEVIVFAADKYPVYAEAVKDSRVLFFYRDTIKEFIRKDPSVADEFMKLLAQKCLALNAQIEMLTLKTVRERLIQFLAKECEGKETCRVLLKFTKTQLARNIGTVSETLSRTLKQLQEEGLIEVKNREIFIKKCRLLKEEL